MNTLFKVSLKLLLSLGLLAGMSSSSFADSLGCTAGFWRNHTESWPSNVRPDTQFQAVFKDTSFENLTLLEALKKEGSEGKCARQATAAYLNAAEFPAFSFNPAQVQGIINSAYILGDPDSLDAICSALEEQNDGECNIR